jgi:hypothetical protein
MEAWSRKDCQEEETKGKRKGNRVYSKSADIRALSNFLPHLFICWEPTLMS